MEHVITFKQGKAKAIYADAIAPVLRALGPVETRRASDVEPDGDGWTATIRPWVPGGEVRLGPFPTRAEALAEEVAYLKGVL